MRRISKIICGLCLGSVCLMSVGACGGNDSRVSVPRPKAYQRIAPVGDSYIKVEGAPSGFEVNAEATVSLNPPPQQLSGQLAGGSSGNHSGSWITVSYPVYNAEIYYTFTPVEISEREKVLDNRLERISLNFSGAPASSTDIVSDDGYFHGRIFTTRERCAFPVQFIMEENGMVVSGSLFMPSMAVNPDSAGPAAEIIARDILHGLRHLEGSGH